MLPDLCMGKRIPCSYQPFPVSLRLAYIRKIKACHRGNYPKVRVRESSFDAIPPLEDRDESSPGEYFSQVNCLLHQVSIATGGKGKPRERVGEMVVLARGDSNQIRGELMRKRSNHAGPPSRGRPPAGRP